MEINSKMCSKKTHNPIQFLTGLVKLFIILPFLLAGCGGGNDATDDNTDQASSESVSFKLPDSISSRLPATGTLAATITINGETPVVMTISADGTTATATLSNIPTGSTTILITFTYDDNFDAPLVVASATKTIDVTTGDNVISFLATEYQTSIHDEDDDGISNLEELDEFSTTSPFDTNCVLGTGTLGNCVL